MLIQTLTLLAIILLIYFLFKTTKIILKIAIVVIVVFVLITLVTKYDLLQISLGGGTFGEGVGEKVNCLAERGVWTKSTAKDFFCNLPTEDGGNSCQDSSECEKLCIADTKTSGHCQEQEYQPGCYMIITNGTAEMSICVD